MALTTAQRETAFRIMAQYLTRPGTILLAMGVSSTDVVTFILNTLGVNTTVTGELAKMLKWWATQQRTRAAQFTTQANDLLATATANTPG